MQFEYLANVEYWCREKDLEFRLPRARVMRGANDTQYEDQQLKPRRNMLLHLLHLD